MLSHGGSSRGTGFHRRRLGTPSSGTRGPSALGRYYPGTRRGLATMVESLLNNVHVPDGDRLAPAYLVPHAGYGQSGAVAAEVYARLRHHADRIERVIVLGPRHREPVPGCVAPHARSWATPLGRTPIDVTAVADLHRDGHIRVDDEPHVGEHSLEIQLPFIQAATPRATFLPMLVGGGAPADVAVTLLALSDPDGVSAGDGTVVLVTTDLGDPATASRTMLSILEMAPERVEGPCGSAGLRGTLSWANHVGLRAELLTRHGDHAAFGFAERHAGPEPTRTVVPGRFPEPRRAQA